MQIASMKFVWNENSERMTNWGYVYWKDLYVGEQDTHIYIAKENSHAQFEAAGGAIPAQTFADFRDAEEYCENEFKKYLNRFLVDAKPVLDIAAFARF